MKRPKKIVFSVGTQINGPPHLGTSLVQSCAFLLAKQAQSVFSVETEVEFGALDNAPYEIKLDPGSHESYQITFRHALGEFQIKELIERFYGTFFEGHLDRLGINYQISTYSEQQQSPEFRRIFLSSLSEIDRLRWCMAPSHGVAHIRIPCPQCFWAEKRSKRTKLASLSAESAVFDCFCSDHWEYRVEVSTSSLCYLDLNTLYRNLVKESLYLEDDDVLPVMVKGGDWSFGCQLVDWAHGILGRKSHQLPARFFCPQVQVETGAKLSKSLIRAGKMETAVDSWVLDTTTWPGDHDDYLDTILWLAENLVGNPKNFYRCYSFQELKRIMNDRPPNSSKKNVRTIRIYRKYFDLIASGEKTVEVRVGYGSMRQIKPGQLLLFTCQQDECATKVLRVAEYPSFAMMMEAEDPKKINPRMDASEQLIEISKIFPPDKEKLGVLCFEVQKV